MKKLISSACILLCAMNLVACAGGIRIPRAAMYYEGEPYEVIQADFEALGFTNIQLVETENDRGQDSDGDVDEVSIAGDSSFDGGQSFPADSVVMISYYSVYDPEKAAQEKAEEEKAAAEKAKADQEAAEKAAREKEEAEKAEAEVEQNSQNQGSSSDQGGGSTSFREAMDSYEAFFDEYIEFMKKFESTDDPSTLLGAYADYMHQYSETMQKLDDIDEDSLSDDDYAYYIEVHTRILEKLAELY